MAFTVRIFGYRGVEQLPTNLPKQFSSDSIYQLVQPYEFREALVCDGATVVASAPQPSTDRTMILRIEVPDAQSIRYEINPPTRQGGVVSADANSPILSGINLFYFRAGWSVSMRDAAGT